MAMSVSSIIQSRIDLRDRRTALKKVFTQQDDILKELESKCDVWLLQKAKEVGVTSFKEAGVGTAYQSEIMHVGAGDWSIIHQWVALNPIERLEIFERRISKGFVTGYMESNNGNPPPALNITRELTMNVRRDAANTKGD